MRPVPRVRMYRQRRPASAIRASGIGWRGVSTLILLAALSGAAAAEREASPKGDAAREQAVALLQQALPNIRIQVDGRLHVASHIASPTGFLTGPDGHGIAVAKTADQAAAAAADRDHPVKAF